jgi:hypothetical protein
MAMRKKEMVKLNHDGDGNVIMRLFFLQGYGEIYFSGKNKIMFIKRTIVF